MTIIRISLALSLFLIGMALGVFFRSESGDEKWSGYAYSTEINGINPTKIGEFYELGKCKHIANIYLNARVSLQFHDPESCKKGCIVDGFLCGKGCSIGGYGPGGFYVSEVDCQQKEDIKMQ